jgi:hypothetical protein
MLVEAGLGSNRTEIKWWARGILGPIWAGTGRAIERWSILRPVAFVCTKGVNIVF